MFLNLLYFLDNIHKILHRRRCLPKIIRTYTAGKRYLLFVSPGCVIIYLMMSHINAASAEV